MQIRVVDSAKKGCMFYAETFMELNFRLQSGRRTSVSDWTDHVAGRLKQKTNDDRLNKESESRRQGWLTSGIDDLWKQVLAQAEEACSEINASREIGMTLVFQPSGKQFTVGSPSFADTLEGSVDSLRKEVTLHLKSENYKPFEQAIAVKITTSGEGYYFATKAGALPAGGVGQIVRTALEALMGL